MAGHEPLPAGGGKLRLKRKRPAEPPTGGGGGPPLPRRPQTQGNSLCWLGEQGLSEADSTWLALLKAVDSQLNHSSFEKVPKLPAFLSKSSQITNPQPKPETFNIGLEQFQWEPFPLYRREVKTNYQRIHQNSENPTISVAGGEVNEDERSGTVSSASEQKPLIANEYITEGSKLKDSTGHSSKDCQKIKNSQRTYQNSKCFAPAAMQKKLGLQELWKKTTTQSREKSWRESEKERASKNDSQTQRNSFNKTTSLLPSQGSPLDTRVNGLQQKPGYQNEDISTLDSCPMCQFHFTGTLSQLDRDSHLAKCLSESTEDVFW
ncbi:Fanconi anemia core complex-associated protein 20 [Eublepharis macularius]|uniref:Fanconi anemia core complex-associated protein 20 n=1 Tax=Eublepharis macularius TaxID=481883 RepID=A0AA97KL03_EUBMA|nr:Fanconi anemia core complex-associated protein 20 [Eublepharis macularius]